jgi:hypothetical protein
VIRNPYPAWGTIAAMISAALKLPLSYHESVVSGKKWLSAEIGRLLTGCPDSKLVLTGYSQGAQVTGDVYQNTSSKKIMGVVLFGDPKFNSNDTASRGGISGLDGALGTRPLYSVEPGKHSVGHVLSYCHDKDPVCQGVSRLHHGSTYHDYASTGEPQQAATYFAQFVPKASSPSPAPSPSPAVPVRIVPAIEQTRIVAEYGPDFTLLPQWSPPGFSWNGWDVESGSFGYLLNRLQVFFKKGTTTVLWEVASGVSDETADAATCEVARSPRVVNGRRTHFYVTASGFPSSYVCVTVKRQIGQATANVQMAVSATGKYGRGVTETELRRMVSSAIVPRRPVPPTSVPPVPADEGRSLRASFKGLLLPTVLPKGFIYTRAGINEPNALTGARRSAFVMFGRSGRRIQWTVGPPYSTRECEEQQGVPRSRIGGRMVSLIQGAKGQAAWFCTSGSPKLQIQAWNDYSISGPALMQLVASAR